MTHYLTMKKACRFALQFVLSIVIMMSKQHCFFVFTHSQSCWSSPHSLSRLQQCVLNNLPGYSSWCYFGICAALVCLVDIYLEQNFEKVCHLVMVQVLLVQAFALLNKFDIVSCTSCLCCGHPSSWIIWIKFCFVVQLWFFIDQILLLL